MKSVSRSVEGVAVTFDDPSLVADAGLIVPATLMVRLGLEALVNERVRLLDRVGGSRPGRKVLTLVASILAGGTHIDHADRLRAGATQRVLPFRVMAPSTLGTFLRSFEHRDWSHAGPARGRPDMLGAAASCRAVTTSYGRKAGCKRQRHQTAINNTNRTYNVGRHHLLIYDDGSRVLDTLTGPR